MDATTVLKPLLSYLQPTSKPEEKSSPPAEIQIHLLSVDPNAAGARRLSPHQCSAFGLQKGPMNSTRIVHNG